MNSVLAAVLIICGCSTLFFCGVLIRHTWAATLGFFLLIPAAIAIFAGWMFSSGRWVIQLVAG